LAAARTAGGRDPSGVAPPALLLLEWLPKAANPSLLAGEDLFAAQEAGEAGGAAIHLLSLNSNAARLN